MVKLIIGDIRKVVSLLEENSIDCVITSPPYWQQRDYGVAGQIGQESTPEEYALEIAEVFRLLYSKLKKTATVFLNVGYKYKDGELLLIPEMVAFEMKKVGYTLKNKVIWHKPNAMPTPARNRLNNTYEVILIFVKDVGREVFYFNLNGIGERQLFDGIEPKNLLLARIEDSISSREKREGFVVAVSNNAVKVRWKDGLEEVFEFAQEQRSAKFECQSCERELDYWDVALSLANYEKFICPYCKSERVPKPILTITNLDTDWIYADGLAAKERITSIRGSSKYKKSQTLTSSPAGRLAVMGEKLVIKRKYRFPQPLIAHYLKEKLKERGMSLRELKDTMGYKHTVEHWLRKDFSHWGRGGSIPRPEDFRRLKQLLGLDEGFERLVCELMAVLSTVKPHPEGKNIGDVWEIPTTPYRGEHFAVFPKKLVERCIRIGCPPKGVVLDPFAGSGTVGEVAQNLGRDALLVEINPEYKKLILQRCKNVEIIQIPNT